MALLGRAISATVFVAVVAGFWLGCTYKINTKSEEQLHTVQYVVRSVEPILGATDVVQVVRFFLSYSQQRIMSRSSLSYIATPDTIGMIGFPQQLMSMFDVWHQNIKNPILQLLAQPLFVLVYSGCHLLMFYSDLATAVEALVIYALDQLGSLLVVQYVADPATPRLAFEHVAIFAANVLAQTVVMMIPWLIYRIFRRGTRRKCAMPRISCGHIIKSCSGCCTCCQGSDSDSEDDDDDVPIHSPRSAPNPALVDLLQPTMPNTR